MVRVKDCFIKSYSVFDDLHYLGNHEDTLKPSSLPRTNVWWVDIHSTLTICLFCTRCLKERQRKVNLSDRISYELRFSFSLIYSNTQFRTKHTLNLGLSRLPKLLHWPEAIKVAHARKTCLCLPISQRRKLPLRVNGNKCTCLAALFCYIQDNCLS